MKLIVNSFKVSFWSLLLVLTVVKVYPQQKRTLTPEDAKLWSQLKYNAMSEDGNWVAYNINHQDAQDTLYVKNTNNSLKYSYPLANGGVFTNDSKWFAYIKEDGVYMKSLGNDKAHSLKGAIGFEFTKAGNYIMAYSDYNFKAGLKTLWIKNLKTLAITCLKNVREFVFNPDKTVLGVITEDQGLNKIALIKFEGGLSTTILQSNSNLGYIGITWNKSGKTLAFYEQLQEQGHNPIAKKVYIYNDFDNTPGSIEILDPLKITGLPEDGYIELAKLYISDDGKQLFLYVGKKKQDTAVSVKNEEKSDVQLWYNDNMKEQKQSVTSQLKWYVWRIGTNDLLAVEDEEYPNIILTGDQKNALVYNTKEYLPTHDYAGEPTYIDLYIKDLVTGNKKLIVKKHINGFGNALVSPSGKYITYFKDKNWWIYDIAKDTHVCLTAGLNVNFENSRYDQPGEKPAYGSPGWFSGDSQVIIYDQFDIWLMSADGTERTRITNGKKTNTTYRIFHVGYWKNVKSSFFGFVAESYNAEKGILITTLNNNNLEEGFCFWDKKSELKQLLQKDMKFYPVTTAGSKKPFVFYESNFSTAPRLVLQKPSGKQQLICQSNPQQKEFYWGKSELIHYNAPDGEQLKGALFYPTDYVSGKKYPMIVYIYERRSDELLKYVPPTINSSYGFNVTNMTAQGYFVLQPDIAYKLNDPGISAAKCVVAAVEKAVENNGVNKDRIGLMGFSYGGYETAFIISQTNLFKAAIAGSGFTNIVNYVLTFPGDTNGQVRMDHSPFFANENKDYERNSTINHVNNINTPVLLWTGNQDPQVEWTESRKLHIALWGLNKKSVLLVYPDEGHGVYKEENMTDITLRVNDWFNYYLKDAPAADWIGK